MTNGSSEDSVRQTSNGEGVGRDKLAAEWIQPGYRAEVQSKMLENQVLQRVREATDLIKSVKLERNEEQPVVSMDWDQLYDVSSNIMEEFTKEMDEIVAELNQSFKVCSTMNTQGGRVTNAMGAEAIALAGGGVYRRLAQRRHPVRRCGKLDEEQRDAPGTEAAGAQCIGAHHQEHARKFDAGIVPAGIRHAMPCSTLHGWVFLPMYKHNLREFSFLRRPVLGVCAIGGFSFTLRDTGV